MTRPFPFDPVSALAALAALAATAMPAVAAPAAFGAPVPSDTSRASAPADSARVDEVMAWMAQEDAARQRADAARRAATPPSALRRRVDALRATLAVPSHLAVPAAAEGLVARQTAVVENGLASAATARGYFFPMIERALAARGLPPELKYVALIESALDAGATSRVGAAGMWQFMPATAADYGLDQWSVRDPVRSTDAAVRYLADLGAAFDGDFQLALAAYNCGPGRVARLAAAHRRRTGETATYWDIRPDLPAETRDYVVRFIAAARLLERRATDA